MKTKENKTKNKTKTNKTKLFKKQRKNRKYEHTINAIHKPIDKE